MNKILAYYDILTESFMERSAGNIAREDDLLADLDKLWLSMSPGERELSKYAAKLALFAYEQGAASPEVAKNLNSAFRSVLLRAGMPAAIVTAHPQPQVYRPQHMPSLSAIKRAETRTCIEEDFVGTGCFA